MRYEVEADWKLLDGCNYRCSYCFWPPETLSRKIAGLPSAERWVDAFAGTGRTWLLHVTGGEPTLHPQFADLCARLAERHYLSINTNLSRDSIAEMARRVAPERVTLIHAALHPEERSRRAGWAAFARNADAVLAAGHHLVASVVATPEALSRFDELAEQCAMIGIRPVPKLVRGTWQGRRYPSGYTDEEKAAFRRAMAWAREGCKRLPPGTERPTVWPLDDDEWIDIPLRFRGSSCEAGRLMAAIHPDGSAYRCGTDGYLGNLLNGDFRLAAEAQICTTSYCFYFCRKYSRSGYWDHSGLLGEPAAARLAIRAA